MGSPNGLIHRGWKRTDLNKGDQVTVEGYHAKNSKNQANARTVTLPDGRKLIRGFQLLRPAPVPLSATSVHIYVYNYVFICEPL